NGRVEQEWVKLRLWITSWGLVFVREAPLMTFVKFLRRTVRQPWDPSYHPHVEALEARALPSFFTAGSYAAGPTPISVAAGDLNGDGFTALAVANFLSSAGTVVVLLGNGDGAFQGLVVHDVGAARSVAVGDFNGDGIPDLVATNWKLIGSMTVLLGNGDGTFQTPVDYAAGAHPRSVAVSTRTALWRIDNAGRMVGWYLEGDLGGKLRGFVATPE